MTYSYRADTQRNQGGMTVVTVAGLAAVFLRNNAGRTERIRCLPAPEQVPRHARQAGKRHAEQARKRRAELARKRRAELARKRHAEQARKRSSRPVNSAGRS